MDYSDAQNLALLLLRVSLGLMMAAHGYAKVFRGGRLAGTAGWFDSIGMRPGRLHAPLAAGSEIGSGLLMALGLLHSFAAMAMIGVMVVAAWTVHRHNGFFIISAGLGVHLHHRRGRRGPGNPRTGRSGRSTRRSVWPMISTALTGLVLALAGVVAGAAQLVVFFRPPAATD